MPRPDAASSASRLAGVAFLLVVAGCGASSHLRQEDAGEPPRDAGAGATGDAALDGGLEYDCAEACSRDPPICIPPGDESMPCLEQCRFIVIARGCVLGEELRLLRCLENHPGACEQRYEGPCAEEWECLNYCNGPYPVVCQPPGE